MAVVKENQKKGELFGDILERFAYPDVRKYGVRFQANVILHNFTAFFRDPGYSLLLRKNDEYIFP